MRSSEIRKELEPLFEQYSFVRALYQENFGLTVSANSRQSTADPLPATRGIVISIWHNGFFYEASSSVLNLASIRKLVQELPLSISSLKLPGSACELIPEQTATGSFSVPVKQSLSLTEKLQLARSYVQEISARDSRIKMTQVRYREVKTREIYISQQKNLEQSLSRFEAVFILVLRSEDGKQSTQIHDGYSRQGGWEHARPDEAMITRMIEDGIRILNAPRLEPGSCQCIFSPSLSGMLAHEAFGHGTEADTMSKGRARGTEFLGKAVASQKVGLYDSPALENAAAAYFFDHEGQLASETRIVQDGILTSAIADHRSASILQYARTPNGRRESFDHKIYTRMTNTFFTPGNAKLEEMIASIKEGYLVDRATNGMEDPKSWGIQLEALIAEKIENGKLTGKIYSPVIVTGYVPDILNSIDMVSQDFEINGLGMCGKGYKEWVKVTDGGPYLRLTARLS